MVHSIQFSCLEAGNWTSWLIHFSGLYSTWPSQEQWPLLASVWLTAWGFNQGSFGFKFKTTQMNVSRKNRKGIIYQKEARIVYGTLSEEIQSEKIKIWNQKLVKKKVSPQIPQSLYTSMTCPTLHLLFCLYASFILLFLQKGSSLFSGFVAEDGHPTPPEFTSLSFVTRRIWLTSLNPNYKSWLGRIWSTFLRHMCPLLVL